MNQRNDAAQLQPAPEISEAEWELRVQLAACYRLVEYYGWSEMIYGHLTARVPGPHDHFLINPFGLNYDEVTASNLVKIDVDGNVISGGHHMVNYAGFVIHSAVHMVHAADNNVVLHTHTRAGMAVAATKEGLQPISMFASYFHGGLAYHEYEGAALRLDERERIVKSLGNAKALILRNHGLLVVGKTVAQAFLRLYRLESACRIQVDAGAAGTLSLMPIDLAAQTAVDLDAFQAMNKRGEGVIEFQALMRKLDGIDNSYRH